jgi:Fur family transcriptional regulator, ferric uptake regulator
MENNLSFNLSCIREKGFRVTPQRQLVLEALQASGTHTTAVSIFEQVNAKLSSINQTTVYRTLDFLCEQRLVAKTEIAGQTVYEIVNEDRHHHLVCRHCGYVEELADHHFIELLAHLAAEHNFIAEIDHVAIPGICAACQ